MSLLASVDQAKDALRIDGTADDANVLLHLRAASLSVLRYLGDLELYQDSFGDIPEDSNGDPDVPEDVRLATIILAGIMLRDPSGMESKDWDHGSLPRIVTSILYPLRDPVLA